MSVSRIKCLASKWQSTLAGFRLLRLKWKLPVQLLLRLLNGPESMAQLTVKHCKELESLRTCLLCLRGKAHCALCMWNSVQLLLSQQVLEARVVQCQSTGALWASLSLFHYHFLTVSSCPFLEFKLHFRKLTLFFFSF